MGPQGHRGRISTSLWRLQVRACLGVYLLLLRLAQRFGPRSRRPLAGASRILVTGTFQSDNWIRAHLGPLAAASNCARVLMVTTSPLPAIPKVEAIFPYCWLTRLVGAVPARLFTFVIVAFRERPEVVGGFHLLVNGLVAALLARAVGARSWYFSVGGPVEIIDGGVWGENPYFARLRTPDPTVERQLLEAVRAFDLIVTMGSGTKDYLRRCGIDANFEVVSGGIDALRFHGSRPKTDFDLILVARLVPIKRIDLFLRVVRQVAQAVPELRAAIVGSGPLRAELEALARDLDVSEHVVFAGHQTDVQGWLARARVFVLTSRSEGLALSLMEAMMCGLPAVVCRVGDLADLVEHGGNGYLVDGSSEEKIAAHIIDLLKNPAQWERCSCGARRAALRYTTTAATDKWERILAGMEDGPSGQRALAAGNNASCDAIVT